MNALKKTLTNGLLAFALISIGFALGKHFRVPDGPPKHLAAGNGRQVVMVYYLHATFRCSTCNTIESMTREVLDGAYPREMADGKIQWLEDDFQENEVLARQFEVVASCVVVADMKDGVITSYKRLDDVWTLMKDQGAFSRYIRSAIDTYLEESGGGA